MATATKSVKRTQEVKEYTFLWTGKNKAGKVVRGEQRAISEAVVNATLRRQGILVSKVSKQGFKGGGKIVDKDIALFTRQLATMMKAGVPLLQTFDIVGRGHDNPAVGKLLLDIKSDVETGSSLSQAFRKFPLYFDQLYCNLIAAGEQAGILETLLERLATYKEKMIAIKSKIKAALFYPVAIIVVAFVITAVIMIFVIPAFKEVFKSFGADLPAPTMIVIGISDFFIAYWWAIFGGIGGSIYAFFYTWKRSETMQIAFDRLFLRMPVFGNIIRKSVIARWTRTLATMFAAGVPLVESLESVGGAAGNYVYKIGTRQIQGEVSTGTSLTSAMQNSELFPNMVNQMVAIGEESGALDSMLGKVADFFEAEVDDAVEALSSLMEPIIMVVLGTLIGGMVIAMYLPIFKLGRSGRMMQGWPFIFLDPIVFNISCGVFGLMVGSFLNVVIHRLPRMMERDWHCQAAELRGEEVPENEAFSLAIPRSRCPECGHQITALENIPLISWLVLRGKCSACHTPISPRYPIVESLTGLLCAFAAAHFGFGWAAAAGMVLICCLIVLTFIDFDTQLLPDSITLPLLWFGLLFNLFATYTDLQSAVIGAMGGYLSLWTVYWGFKLATGKEGMGYGDFKLLAALGAWLGWQILPMIILLSSLVGAVVGIGLIVLAKRGRHVPIPFGPYLAAAGLLALFWGKDLTQSYLRLM